jgi:hypothetical protein
MNVFLWVLQVVLAVAFAAAGLMKATQPKEKLRESMAWVDDFSPPVIRFIGIVELLGAIGLILPAATGIATWLTPLAATGLAAQMVLASATHFRRKEFSVLPINAILFVLAVVVAWGRFGPYGP